MMLTGWAVVCDLCQDAYPAGRVTDADPVLIDGRQRCARCAAPIHPAVWPGMVRVDVNVEGLVAAPLIR
jgi:hypothetical protein